MPDPKQSRAVRSMQKEQTLHRESGFDSDLEAGLEDTIPVSDPGSMTDTAVPADRANAGEADRIRRQSQSDKEFPLVEEALRSTGEGRRSEDVDDVGRERLRALRRDADRMAETAAEVASGATSLFKSEVRTFVSDVESTIRKRPITAVAIVAAVAFVFGATR